jgi:gamma-glutamylcyclotransferase (GGCT)/AIG2-like uncharacterized protein YtfP
MRCISTSAAKTGSGKCNAFHTGVATDVVFGVVFEMPEHEFEALDRAEGPDYDRQDIRLAVAGQQFHAHLYIAKATAIEDGLEPYDWYRGLCDRGCEGARAS